jgi:hypothetical protein
VSHDSPSFRIDAVGGRDRASSRLRAWKLGDFLSGRGFPVQVSGPFDILVCQKTYPFALARDARQAGKIVVFDLDDPDYERSSAWMDKIRRFMRLAHVVTTGSDYLKERLDRFHPEVHILENPVDVGDPTIVHPGRGWRGKAVWFGAPENLWMLQRLKLRTPVQTLTKGGDIPFTLHTVDRVLCGFDLALLPVFLNEETRAKNANRLVKCAALGLPFLAGDTPEHRKAVHRLGLPESVLVSEGRDWDAAIAAVAREYPQRVAVARACRAGAWRHYAAERVFADWLTVCLDAWGRTRAEADP